MMQYRSKNISTYLQLLLITIVQSVLIGSIIAFFLWLLELATIYRIAHAWLLYFLPLAGLLIYLAYHRWGQKSNAGNNLVIAEIQRPSRQIPLVMAPLVLFGTVVTHLFGGSAGREGTAVQIGGSVASQFTRWFTLDNRQQRLLLSAGVAAAFAAVFGTPVTGIIFAMEFVVVGKLKFESFLPSLLGAYVGHYTCIHWGVHHTAYHVRVGTVGVFDIIELCKIIPAGICFGLAALIFSEGIWRVKNVLISIVKIPWLLPVVGGVLIIVLSYFVGSDYLGLGVLPNKVGDVSLPSAFTTSGAHTWSWWWKIVFTVVTLASGYKGGEVTPLFFIGAMLGNTLSGVLGLPVDLMAGVGFVAVFAGATNTPFACTVMGVELFGAEYAAYFAVGCFVAFICSGNSGIYAAQQMGFDKFRLRKKEGENTLAQVISDRRAREQSFLAKLKRFLQRK